MGIREERFRKGQRGVYDIPAIVDTTAESAIREKRKREIDEKRRMYATDGMQRYDYNEFICFLLFGNRQPNEDSSIEEQVQELFSEYTLKAIQNRIQSWRETENKDIQFIEGLIKKFIDGEKTERQIRYLMGRQLTRRPKPLKNLLSAKFEESLNEAKVQMGLDEEEEER